MRYLLALFMSANLLYAAPEYRVAIFGTNFTEEDSQDWFDDPFLLKLFSTMKIQKPDAVFFTGDLLLGLENSGPIKPEIFKKQLDLFTQIKNKYLGEDIPIYPTLGNHLPATFEIIETFRDHFKIQKISPRPPYHLAYTVSIDGAEFIVLATGYDEPDGATESDTKPNLQMLNWLDKHLQENSGSYTYHFVLSHFPAFSSTAVSGVYLGLDKDPNKRDIFWNILRKNHVNAFFCSYEPMYDRSNRSGIWQVISGGIVMQRGGPQESRKFPHFLILTWGGENEFPLLKVIDLDGKVWDSFNVTPLNFPVHQMRISVKYDETKKG